jgi:hypothetical protein
LRFAPLPRLGSLPRLCSALVLAAATLAAAAPASAFCRSTTCKGKDCTLDDDGCPKDGKKLFWTSSCVGFSFDVQLLSSQGEKLYSKKLDPVKATNSIRKAFVEWSSIDCPDGSGQADMRFVELSEVSCRVSAYNAKGPNVNVVLFQDDSWKYRGEDNTLAKTTVTFDPSTGEILDADIEVNTAINDVTVVDPVGGEEAFDPNVKYDLRSLMTHEIGHFLGIAHSPYPDATMFASYSEGTTDLRSISDDDREALCAAYPPARGAFCAPDPRGGLLKDCGPVADDATGAAAAKEDGCSVHAPGAPRSDLDSPLALSSAILLALASRHKRRPPTPS